MNSISNTYIINLPKDTLRLKETLEQTSIFPKRVIVSPGVESRNIPEKMKKYVNPDNFVPKGALGCALAHIRVWEQIVENDDAFGLILEDDILLTDNFLEKFNRIFPTVPKDFYILYLGCHLGCDIKKEYSFEYSIVSLINKFRKKVVAINENVFTPASPLATHSYILSNKGAKHLLSYFSKNKIQAHVDMQILEPIYKVPSYAINPVLAKQRVLDINLSNNTPNKYPIILNEYFSKFIDDDNTPMSYKLSVPGAEISGTPVNMYTALFFILGIILGISGIRIESVFVFVSIFSLIEINKTFEASFNREITSKFLKNTLLMVVVLFTGFLISSKKN